MIMKTNFIIILLTVFVFSACIIREPDPNPDVTKTGKELFQHTEFSILSLTNHFDIALRIDTYRNTPDSLKETVRQTYLENYGVILKKPSTWYLKYKKDTLYTIISDTKSIQSTGASWSVKNSTSNKFTTITSLSANKWKIEAAESEVGNWEQNSDLEIRCTDATTPASFGTSNFKIMGNGVLKLTSSRQNVIVNYSITDSLKRVPNLYLFRGGKVSMSAKENNSAVNELATAEYITNTSKYPFVRITYKSYSQVYENWVSNTFFREDEEYFGIYY